MSSDDLETGDNITTDENATLEDAGDYDVIGYRKEQIENIRSEAIQRAEDMRLALAQGQLRDTSKDVPNSDMVRHDTPDRVARTVFREKVEHFVRESFQLIATPEAKGQLRRDYLHGINLASVVSDPPKEILEEIKSKRRNQRMRREFVTRQKQRFKSGQETKRVDIVGLRQLVDTPSPLEFGHDASLDMVSTKGPSRTLLETQTYVDVRELSWTELHNIIEYTTMALDDVGIGFDFDADNTGWDAYKSDADTDTSQ